MFYCFRVSFTLKSYYDQLSLQNAPIAKNCWLSHGSLAITALCDMEEDGAVVEIEDEECSEEQEDSQVRRISSSTPKVSNPVPVQQDSAVQPLHSPAVLAQQESALVTSAICWLGDMKKKNRTCKSKLMIIKGQ